MSSIGLIYSCVNDVEIESSKNIVGRSNGALTVDEAKILVESSSSLSLPDLSKNFQLKPQTRSASKLKYDPTSVVPDWTTTQEFTEEDAAILMIPLELKTPILGVTRTFVDGKENRAAVQIYSKLLVKKNKSRQLLGVIVSYLPDHEYWEEEDCNINKLGYELGGTNYSGIYMVSSLDGNMIYGEKFEKGQSLFRFYPNWRKDMCEGDECHHEDSVGHKDSQKYRLHIEFLDTSHSVKTRFVNTEGDNVKCMFCGQNPMYCNCIIIEDNYICSQCHHEIVNGKCECCPLCHYSPCRCCWSCKKYPCTCWGYKPTYPPTNPPINPPTGPTTGGAPITGGGGTTTGGNPTSTVSTQAQIKSAAKKAVSKVLNDHKNDSTSAHCNEGVRNAFYELFSSKELYNMCANDMVKHWKDNPSKWEKIEMKDAQKLANEGKFVVAGWVNPKGSGHVVVIVPGEEKAKNWNGASNVKIPNTMDTGANMRTESQPINMSFGKSKHNDVTFFKYK